MAISSVRPTRTAASRGRRRTWLRSSRARSAEFQGLNFGTPAPTIGAMPLLKDQIDARARPRAGAFFGRRKGHKLKPRQAALLDTLLPRLAIDLSNPPPSDLRGLF